MHTNITGRDDYIVCQALVYAVAAIQALPHKQQEWNNMVDMAAPARASTDMETLARLSVAVEQKFGHDVDLFPHLEPTDVVRERVEFDLHASNYRAKHARLMTRVWDEAREAKRVMLDVLDHPASDLPEVAAAFADLSTRTHN